jgi:flagellar basal body rod protein FlgG
LNAFDIAALSMDTDMQRLANIGQNLANVQTGGYKRVVVAQRPFAETMAAMDGTGAAFDPTPSTAPDTALDMTAGPLRASASPLDLAVQGDGFFEFESPQGPALSRQAVLHVDGQGRLVNDAGLAIRSDRGDLRVPTPTSDLRIDAQGEVWAGDRSLGKLQLSRVGDPTALQPLGGGLYRPAADDATQPIDTPHVLSGQREGSNVSSSAEMVRLMETSRHFEAMAKVVQGYDDAMDKAIRKLGDLGT